MRKLNVDQERFLAAGDDDRPEMGIDAIAQEERASARKAKVAHSPNALQSSGLEPHVDAKLKELSRRAGANAAALVRRHGPVGAANAMLAWDEVVTSEMAMLWVHNGKRQIREEKSKPARGSDDDEISDPPAPPRKGADKSASRSASRPKSSPDASSTAWVFNDVSEEDRQAVAAVVDLRLMVARKLDLTDCDRDVAEAEVAALLCVPVDVVRRCAGARGVQPKRSSGRSAGRSSGGAARDLFSSMNSDRGANSERGSVASQSVFSSVAFGLPGAPSLGSVRSQPTATRRSASSSSSKSSSSDSEHSRRRGRPVGGASSRFDSADVRGERRSASEPRRKGSGGFYGADGDDVGGDLENDNAVSAMREALSLNEHVSRKPMRVHETPMVTYPGQLTLFDDALVFIMRGADSSERETALAHGEYGEIAINTIMAHIGDAALSEDNPGGRPKYPFPVVMTEAVALALVSMNWGAVGPTGARNKTDFTYDDVGLLVNDLALPDDEDMSWIKSKVAVHGYTPSTSPIPRHAVSFVPSDGKFKTWYKLVQAQNELFGMFYGEDHRDQRDRAAKVFKKLHKRQRALYPLHILALAWEQMVRAYDRAMRVQLRGFIRHCENTGNSVNSQWAFRSIQRAIFSSRRSGHKLEFKWPQMFVDVAATDSYFHRVVMTRFLAKGQEMALIRGVSDFEVNLQPKRGRGGAMGGAELDDGDGSDDGADDGGVGVPATGAKAASAGGAKPAAAAPPASAPAAAPLTAAKARAFLRAEKQARASRRAARGAVGAAPPAGLKFGASYSGALVKFGLFRSIWQNGLEQWIQLTGAERNGVRDPSKKIPCLAAATAAGCALSEADCSATWVAWGCAGCVHGTKMFGNHHAALSKPENLELRILVWRGGGAHGFGEHCEPAGVEAKVAPLVERWRLQQQGPAGGACGAAAETLVEPAAVGDAGAREDYAAGRGGRQAPAVLVEQERLSSEAKLEEALHSNVDWDVAVSPGAVAVPSDGFTEFWDLEDADANERDTERVRQWLCGSAKVQSWSAALDDDAYAYVTARCAGLVSDQFPDPVESLASPDEAVDLVLEPLLRDVARSSERARRVWAESLLPAEASGGACGRAARAEGAAVVLAVARYPGAGKELDVVLLGCKHSAVDHGEFLMTAGSSVVQGKKCLFLAVGGALGISAAALHAGVCEAAAQFGRSLSFAPSDLVLEPFLQARSVAHDLLTAHHTQTRLDFVFFPSQHLYNREIVFVCAEPGGGLTVEILTGVDFAGAPEARGWVVCARRHAVELRVPRMTVPEFNAWCVSVGKHTGRMPQRYFMQGWRSIFAGVKAFPGEVPRRAVSSLAPCEQCAAPHVRLGALACAGAREECGAQQPEGDPLLQRVSQTPVAAIVGTHSAALCAVSDARSRVLDGAIADVCGEGDACGAVGGSDDKYVVPSTSIDALFAKRSADVHREYAGYASSIGGDYGGETYDDELVRVGLKVTDTEEKRDEQRQVLAELDKLCSGKLADAESIEPPWAQEAPVPQAAPARSRLSGKKKRAKSERRRRAAEAASAEEQHVGGDGEHFHRHAASAAVSPTH